MMSTLLESDVLKKKKRPKFLFIIKKNRTFVHKL